MRHFDLSFRKIEEKDFETVLAIYESNPDYFEQASNTFPTMQTVRDDFSARPPQSSENEKHYALVYMAHQPVAVIDFLTHFPIARTIHIGLLMIHGALHAQGLGKQILHVLEESHQAFEKLRIGVLEHNTQAMHFWKNNGFNVVDTKEITMLEKMHTVFMMERRIHHHPINKTTAP